MSITEKQIQDAKRWRFVMKASCNEGSGEFLAMEKFAAIEEDSGEAETPERFEAVVDAAMASLE